MDSPQRTQIPLVMSGGLGGTLKTGRTLDYEGVADRKMSSLLLSIMDRMNVPITKFGNATDQLVGL